MLSHDWLPWLAALVAVGAAAAAYVVIVEPLRRPRIARYQLAPARWPPGLELTIAVLADFHACRPWMSPERIAAIARQTNALNPDLIVLLGDYIADYRFVTAHLDPAQWSQPLAALTAPLGVHAILGNHDWWLDGAVQRSGRGVPFAKAALEAVGIRVYHNEAVRIAKDGHALWLAGLGDQRAFWPHHRRLGRLVGADDLAGTLAQASDDAPVILLAHEPDIMVEVPDRVALVLAGHTHGGQVRLFGWSPLVPSRFGNRFAYGHVREHTDLVVSGGLGCSIMPLRFGMPPEIGFINLRHLSGAREA